MDKSDPDKTHRGDELELYALADERGVIEGHAFYGCLLNGPAVLLFHRSIPGRNYTAAPPRVAVYDLPAYQTQVVGALAAVNCSFEECVFASVGFVVHPEQRDAFMANLVHLPGHSAPAV